LKKKHLNKSQDRNIPLGADDQHIIIHLYVKGGYILVTPTFVKVQPDPERRCIIGDISDINAIRILPQLWLEEVDCIATIDRVAGEPN